MKKLLGPLPIYFVIFLAIAGTYTYALTPHLEFHPPKKDSKIVVNKDSVEALEGFIVEALSVNEEIEKTHQTEILSSYELNPYIVKTKEETSKTSEVVAETAEQINSRELLDSWIDTESEQSLQETYELTKTFNEEIAAPKKGEITLNTRDIGRHNGFKNAVEREEVSSVSSMLKRANVKERLAHLRREENARQDRRKKMLVASVDEDYYSYNPENLELFEKDSVGVVQAKSKKEDEIDEDDFVVFDYSNSEAEKNSYAANRDERVALTSHQASHMGDLPDVAISSNVQNTISRAINNSSSVTTQSNESSEIQLPEEIAKKFMNNQVAKNTGSGAGADDYAGMIGAAMSGADDQGDVNTQTTIRTFEVRIGKDVDSQGQVVSNYEFVPEYDKNEYLADRDGELTIQNNLASKSAVMRGTILKGGYMRTKIDLYLERGGFVQPVPMFEQHEFSEFLRDENLQARGGFLLVEIDETIDYVDLDVYFERKIFMDENFQVLEEPGTHRYILIVGAETGNVLLSYETGDGQVADQIVHVVEDEIVYTMGLMQKHGRDTLEIYERNIMSHEPMKLRLNAQNVKYFNRNSTSEILSLNRYAVNRPIRPLGMRRYYEINSFGPILMAGMGEESRLELPSQQFVNKVLDGFGIDGLAGQCLIQLNFSKEVEELLFGGETHIGPMYTEELYLDRDGIFSGYSSDLTTNGFIIGDLQGLINFKVRYYDGTEDIFQSYCSPETYLVEQL